MERILLISCCLCYYTRNRFDFLLMSVSVVDLVLTSFSTDSRTAFAVFRLIRVTPKEWDTIVESLQPQYSTFALVAGVIVLWHL
jgi:hypothetical protein